MCRIGLNASLTKEGVVLFQPGIKTVLVLEIERQLFLFHLFSEKCSVSTQ